MTQPRDLLPGRNDLGSRRSADRRFYLKPTSELRQAFGRRVSARCRRARAATIQGSGLRGSSRLRGARAWLRNGSGRWAPTLLGRPSLCPVARPRERASRLIASPPLGNGHGHAPSGVCLRSWLFMAFKPARQMESKACAGPTLDRDSRARKAMIGSRAKRSRCRSTRSAHHRPRSPATGQGVALSSRAREAGSGSFSAGLARKSRGPGAPRGAPRPRPLPCGWPRDTRAKR